MKRLAIIVLAIGTACSAQTPALSSVRSRCARLELAVKSAAGGQQDIIAQALDDCRSEVLLLTPRKVSKIEKLSGYLAPALALAQVGYAAKRNMDWLELRKRQKNAGQVEFNFAGETFVAGYIGEGLVARAFRDWKRHRRAVVGKTDMHDAVTDAVLMPH